MEEKVFLALLDRVKGACVYLFVFDDGRKKKCSAKTKPSFIFSDHQKNGKFGSTTQNAKRKQNQH